MANENSDPRDRSDATVIKTAAHVEPSGAAGQRQGPLCGFVANHLDVKCELPVELLPGHYLEEATEDQGRQIQSLLAKYQSYPYRLFQISTYFVVNRHDGSAFRASNDGFIAIENASRLTDVELDLSAQVWPDGCESVGWPIGRALFPHLSFSERHTVDEAWVADLKAIAARIAVVSPKHPDIDRALELFRQVGAVDRVHLLHFLGLFAVVEVLITHDPEGSYDSLGHQIKTKIALLERRFVKALDYREFRTAKKEKVWSLLYAFRSRVAHGAPVDFSRDLQVLGSPQTATKFLRQATKQLLRCALLDPDLILDLRAI